MKNPFSTESKINSEMNIVPFIDICLVLLVVFMISSIVDRSSIEVQLPKAEISHTSTANDTVDNTLIISISKDNDIYITSSFLSMLDHKINASELSGLLEMLKKDSKTSDVFIRADANTRYQNLISVLNECKRGKYFNVKLVTDKAEGGDDR
ncbi:ExbD/TolR family protein [Photobacterium damselae]|uniref:ExbD/TolR family protein n=1 Tax=Photobacterium damselae TaxID=38293 RepID=UPI001F2CA9C0|nr:biopolymer transporter ExbD [Photobacterium damselae]UKA04593.1 biopolymer transporter ExbD [Photobacterium damselae subsp. damselae]